MEQLFPQQEASMKPKKPWEKSAAFVYSDCWELSLRLPSSFIKLSLPWSNLAIPFCASSS